MKNRYVVYRFLLVFLGVCLLNMPHIKTMVTAADTVSAGYYGGLDRYEILASNVNVQDLFGNMASFSSGGSTDFFGSAVALSAGGTFVVFGAGNANSGQGELYVYRRDVNNMWNLLQSIPSPTTTIASGFGSTLAISADGSIIAAGAAEQFGSGGTGVVYLYLQDPTTGLYALEQTILDPNSDPNDSFGATISLAATGAVLLIGNPTLNNGQGIAYTYVRSAACSNCVGLTTTTTAWVLQQQILEPVPGPHNFGNAVTLSADGNFAAVGAYGEGANGSGVVYVLQQSAGTWNVVATLNPTDALGAYAFGTALSISGDGRYVVVGAPGQGDSGLVYIFYRSGSVWTQQALIASQTDVMGAVGTGYAVDISNDGAKVAFYATQTGGVLGAVEVHARCDATWHYMQTLLGNHAQDTPDYFGGALALSADGSFLAMGAPLTTPVESGSGYIFSPICAFVPGDLVVSGSLCVQGDVTIKGNLLLATLQKLRGDYELLCEKVKKLEKGIIDGEMVSHS